MAQCAASPSCVKLCPWSSCVKQRRYVPQNSHFRASYRKYSRGRCRDIQLSTWEIYGVGLSSLGASSRPKEASLKSSCLGSLVGFESATSCDWVSMSDQLLLIASICLTYMAGIIPLQKSNFCTQKNVLDDNVVLESSASSGSGSKHHDVNLKYAWDAVKEKLLDSLDAIEHRSKLGNKVLEYEQQHVKQPLSLYAIAEGPKLRLLFASFQWLEEEVNNFLGNCEAIDMNEWLTMFPEIIKKSCYPVCMSWLVQELQVENKPNKALVCSMIEKLKGNDIVLQNIRKSGKEDLYAELLYSLRSGSLSRNSCCYDQSLFILHGSSILEDLVITLADGIASVYLELISVDGNISNETNSLDFGMCNLSTRALQRLRNEVALNQWLYQNAEAVVSMYEDRFDLCTLQLKVIEEPHQNHTENSRWWRKLTLRKSGFSSSLCYVVISQLSMPVKRTKELRALTGWRYYFSLYLELSDVIMPLIRMVIDKVSHAISFFLVSLIGRSLGLIYTGIRQSLRWK